MEPVGIGLVGCGSWGKMFAQALAETPQARVLAAADEDLARAEKIAGEFPGAVALQGHQKLLEMPSVEAVLAVIPTPTHAEVVCQALQAGKHVLVEKPIAVTLEEAKRMVAAAGEAGRSLMVGQIMRFMPATQEVRRRVAAGEIGRPLHVIERRYGSFRKDAWPDWWVEMDGFLLLHLGSHSVDAILWMLEAGPRWAFAQGLARKVDSRHGAIDSFALTLGLEEEILAGIHHEATGGAPGLVYSLLVVGDTGKLELDEFSTVRLNGEIVYYQEEAIFPAALQAELAEFCASIREGRPPSVSGEDVLPAVACLEAARRSLHSGQAEPVES